MGEIGQIPNHQVKVDNWPLFFLQRLHHFYRKKSHCDLTLLFSTLDTVKSVKVHKLVLHACTDYFESLDIMKDSEHGEFLQLSNEMHPDVIIPIISFMYTGKLEFPVTLQPRLYEAATKLRMTILTKLLDVQPNKPSKKVPTRVPEECITKVSILQNDTLNTTENTQDGQDMGFVEISQLSSNYSSPSSSKQVEKPIVTLTPVSMMSLQQKQNLKPDVTFVQRSDGTFPKTNNQFKTKFAKKNIGLQFTTVPSKPKIVDVSLPPTLPGRKLPVWKRKVPFTGSQSFTENIQNVRSFFRPAESPKPTRFEWEEDLNDPTALKPVEDAMRILSHDGTIKVTHPIILEGDGITQQRENLGDSLKRSSNGSISESPPYKRLRSDLKDMKEYGKQQQLRNEIICSEVNSEDMMDTDDLYGPCENESNEPSNFSESNVNLKFSSIPKPILKTESKPELPVASKRVRFSLEGKENNQQQNESVSDFTSTNQPESAVSNQKIVLPMNANQLQSGEHHIKIVSEVLKKYPNLAKREHIKLRVVSKNMAAVPPTVQHALEGDTGGGNKSASSVVSYIFVTNKSFGDMLPVKSESSEKDKLFDVENKTGPWFCHVCDELNPIEFESYYTYRRHLVEVHELKIDVRICEYCGLKNSKRNHLLYHLYTKHGIDPPANVSFPKCSECDYIALSDALLVKHKNTHDLKGLTCYTCNVVFKSFSSMQIHLQSSWHKLNCPVILSDYPCPFCQARFDNGNELKDHIETGHHSEAPATREGKQIYRCPYCEALFGDGDKLGKHIVSIHWGKNNQVPNQGTNLEMFEGQSGQQLQYSEDTVDSGEVETTEARPSSDLESLSNVASGIATSLSLVGNEQAVVYYEQRTEGQDIGREATVVSGDECKDYIITSSAEEVDSRQDQNTENVELVDIENEDSNSRTWNTEEVNPTSCSDHDYSEPQADENLRQIIPVHSIQNQISENPVIQQISPDQKLVFSNEANVVFQPSCVSLPQGVLLTSGKVVLPQISHGGQNVILSQVIPQTQIILSSPILQQPGGIIEDGSGTIVFANPETADHMEGIQSTLQYSIENPEADKNNEPEESEAGVTNMEDENQEMEEEEKKMNDEDVKQIDVSVENSQELSEAHESIMEEDEEEEVEEEDEDENVPTSDNKTEDSKTTMSVETSKIVDDWDETNENQQNIESRSDGPSRPDFF